jgi:hypothetical protein
LPKGKREGPEWVALNPTRVDEHLGSFKVNLESGQWADFATGERGGDLVSLYAYLKRVSQIQAARELAQRLGITNNPSKQAEKPDNSPPKQAEKPEWKPIVPVPDDAPPPSKTHPIHGKPSHVWTYRDTKGATLCQSCRFDFVNEQGDPDKTFSPLTYCECTKAGKEGKRHVEIGEREWRWKGLTGPKPLYNLNKLIANPAAPVVMTEGEKAADAAAILFPSHIATTTLNGARSPHKTDFSPLQGHTVWIFPDNDEPGRKYAEAVVQLLCRAGAREVMLLHTSGEHPEGWDAANALEEGWTPAKGYELIRASLPISNKAPENTASQLWNPVTPQEGGDLSPADAQAEAGIDKVEQEEKKKSAIDEARARLWDLEKRGKEDPGALFEEQTLSDIRLIRDQDAVMWGRLKPVLSKHRVLRDIERYLKQRYEEPDMPANVSENGVAMAVAEQLSHRYRYDGKCERWLAYDGCTWLPIDDYLIETMIYSFARELCNDNFTARFLDGVVKLAKKAMPAFPECEMRGFISMANGVLDIATLTLSAHKPEMGWRWKIPHNYTPGDHCPITKAWFNYVSYDSSLDYLNFDK